MRGIMVNLVISGCNGYMGRVVAALAEADPDITVVAGIDVVNTKTDAYPVHADPAGFTGAADVVIDFSSPMALDSLLAFSTSRGIPLVLCTTGYTSEQLDAIADASKRVPLFRSGNMSLGVNLLVDLVKRACSVLGAAFDVEIVERHHRRKVDAPSGTALMLADAAASRLPYDPVYAYNRQSVRQPRSADEIGISSVRGGTIVGQHEVIFAGLNEVVELRHSAESRDVFASGAIAAAKFMAQVETPGLYDMADVLKMYSE